MATQLEAIANEMMVLDRVVASGDSEKWSDSSDIF